MATVIRGINAIATARARAAKAFKTLTQTRAAILRRKRGRRGNVPKART
ncbi:MAG: hypothetical protein ACLS7Z_10965 [Christensenellales bacterium]